MTANGGPFWDKTLRLIRDIWPLGERDELRDRVQKDLPESDLDKIRRAIDACLEGKGGEVSARSRAAELGRAYLVLNREGRKRFLELLAREYSVDNVAVERAIEERSTISTAFELQEANHKLQNLLTAPRRKLLGQFNELPDGVKFLVDMRAELLPLVKKDSELKPFDRDMHRLLASWFDIGFLDLQRITWDTPAVILERLIKYEAVHAISSWEDMKNRLREDRRCYGFFHPSMPDEPLIFVEVALVNGLADNVQELLDVNAPPGDPDKADTAIFYSISNCQKGLAGVSFGNFLIKRVVADLSTKLPNLKTFSTLSPIPGLMSWLEKNSAELDSREQQVLKKLQNGDGAVEYLQEMFVDDPESKEKEGDRVECKNVMLSLCAKYLLKTKRGSQAYDRVAHFHLSNGAMIERINWGGNLSRTGIVQSASIMVNYLYKLGQIEKNHELYTGKGEVNSSSAVRKLLKG
ncbi:malonyl-CoA decarboxylase [Desulfopila sp. IMCC35008]|uniref:malonyl-CoA decarboxylase n=1 Tax=Desulfopila sp. IMCC35008 TaxID=2653858 RepID=UPI0013CF7D18|nr:malonyl-CoA decarboxylase [Desulfopila sp. IMCC35008]